MSASELEAMTDKQLQDFFEPMFNVTRPERVNRQENASRDKEEPRVYLSPAKIKAIKLLEAEGIDIGFIKKFRK